MIMLAAVVQRDPEGRFMQRAEAQQVVHVVADASTLQPPDLIKI